MSVRKVLFGVMVTAFAWATAPASASADWLITPFVGGNFGGDVTISGGDASFDDEVEKRVDFGAALGWMGNGIAGFEVDFGYSPNFFENTIGDSNFEFGDNNELTLMGNFLIGIPVGGQSGLGVRPYASTGVGMMRNHISGAGIFSDVNHNDFGFNVGGGLQGFFSDHVGIRGDARYFRSFQDHEPDGEFDLGLSSFDFWRGTVGLTFRFGND